LLIYNRERGYTKFVGKNVTGRMKRFRPHKGWLRNFARATEVLRYVAC